MSEGDEAGARSRTPRRAGTALAVILAIGALVRAEAQQADRFAGHPEAEKRLRAAAVEKKLAYPLRDVALKVEKAARRLTLLAQGKPVRTYRVALGPNPEGHKAREGDGRTPEGEYWICTRNEKSKYHLFLGLSYPLPRDAERALRAKEIDEATARGIRATRRPAAPPWDTPLGGAVGIHGCGSEKDWTLGCIALENADMDELWLACPLGTSVTIVP